MWRPLFPAEPRAIAKIRALVASVDAREPDGACDLADRAVLRAQLAIDDVVPDPDDRGGAALSEAVGRVTRSRQAPGLYTGAARVGWAVAALADGELADLVCARVDQALLRVVDDDDDEHFDLISGITGFGVYALTRGEAGHPLAARVVQALARRARERPVGLAWHTAPALVPESHRAPAGYWNLGVAHGTPGVIGFLARCADAGVETETARRLVDGALAFLDDVGRTGFGDWIVDAEPGVPDRALKWCYFDLGIAFALYAAGRRDQALALARDCAGREGVDGGALCHGAAGAMHQFLRLYHATGEQLFADAAARWFERVLAMPAPSETSILEGAAGVALALHAAITDAEPTWDATMLLDVR